MPPTSASVDFYSGSRLLQPLTHVLGLSIDQVNFLACQIFALIIGFPFRRFFHPKTTDPKLRHAVEFILGVALLLFCFGRQTLHVFAHAIIGYLLMHFLGRKWMPHVVFIFALGYLSVGHIYRMYYDYGGFTLDITGPLMITVQKITSIAFALHDGIQVDEKTLNPNQKSKAIKKMPDLLSYLSYMFCFHDVMCGPFVFYHDYLAFIDGSCYVQSAKGGSDDKKDDDNIPSPVETVLKKLIVSVILGVLMMMEPYIAPWERLKDEEFLHHSSWAYKMVYLLVSMSMHRPMYYFAWTLGELVNNSCGLGFNGYDEKGNAKWNLMRNVDIYNLEFSTSLKVNIDSWNVTTSQWLRYAVYERVPSSLAVWVVFIVSAFWHGFYPGYYIAFLTAALFTTAARLVRRNVHQFFQQSYQQSVFYDCVTFVFARFANCIMVVPFVLLEVKITLFLYQAIYWWLHILSVLVIVYFTFIHKMFHRPRKDNNSQKAN